MFSVYLNESGVNCFLFGERFIIFPKFFICQFSTSVTLDIVETLLDYTHTSISFAVLE